TPASDVYALGVTYFCMLTGRLPFTARSIAELARKVTTERIPNLREQFPDVTLEMAECLNRLMSRTAEHRPQDGIEAIQLLNAVAGEVRDVESLLREAFGDSKGITWRRCDSRYRVDISFQDGRRQGVFVEPSGHRTEERL